MRTRASAYFTLLPLLPYHFEVSAPLGLSFFPLPSFLFDLFYREQRSDKITRAESRKKREQKNREVNLKGLQKINDRLGELLEDQNLFLEHPNVRKGIKGKDSRKEELVRTLSTYDSLIISSQPLVHSFSFRHSNTRKHYIISKTLHLEQRSQQGLPNPCQESETQNRLLSAQQ